MIKARAQNAPWHRAIEILLIDKTIDGRSGYGQSVEFHVPEKDGMIVEPTFKLDYDDAQELMDDLWTCGLRPTEGSGSAGALAATQEHLKDMRKLVFDFVEKNK